MIYFFFQQPLQPPWQRCPHTYPCLLPPFSSALSFVWKPAATLSCLWYYHGEKDCHIFMVSSCDSLGWYNSSNLLFSLVWNCCSNGLYFNSLIVLFWWNGFSQVVKPKSNCGFARFSTLPFWDWLSLLVALSLTFHVFTLYSKISYKIHRVLQLKCNLFTFLVEVIALRG